MGNSCTTDTTDEFEGTSMYSNLTPAQEVFQEGRVPVVNQNPTKFNDDDPIDVPNNKSPQRQANDGIDLLQQKDYNLHENLQLKSLRQNQNEVQVALLVSVISNELQLENQMGRVTARPGIDLIYVIDHSGSMSGEKIKLVKRTLKHMLEFLNDKDRLCLIQFDCKCYRLTRLMRVSEDNIPKFRIAIHSIQARGGTNIENGMHMAFSIIKHRKQRNPVTGIFLLSDGVDDGAEERVKSSLRNCNIKDTFTIKTFGFGRDVCPKIMSEIAHLKEGQFNFLPVLDRIDECFVEAVGGLVSVVGNNVQIFVKNLSSNKSKITKAYGDKWQYDNWNAVYNLYQPHLLSGVHKDFIFELSIPNSQSHDPAVVSVRVEVEPINGQNKVIIEQSIQINSSYEGGVQNQDVMGNYMRVQGAECLQNAMLQAENGNHQQGQQMIGQALQQMNQNSSIHDPQVDMVRNDLQLAQKYCYPGQIKNLYLQSQYEVEGRHNMMQLHIVHMYQKSRGVQIYQQDGNGQLIDCAYQNNVQRAYKDQTIQMKLNPNYGQ